jgi:hypothetical protein
MTQADIRRNNGGAILPEDIQRFIRWNLDHYRGNIDFVHDHAVYIESGRGEFEDFILGEFHELEESEFDQAWQVVASDPDYAELANLDLIKLAQSAQEKP